MENCTHRLGDIAQKAYLPFTTSQPDIQPIFCTRDASTLNALAQQYRVAETTTRYQALLNFQPDAVMIHAATSIHPEIARYFLEHGIATFVDKPLADSYQECEALYQLAEQKQVPLYIGFNRRHLPLIQEHSLSDIASLRSLRWEKHRHALPGEAKTFLFDDFIHPLDSINIHGDIDFEDIDIHYQKDGEKLARIDIKWQQHGALFEASMNRQFGMTQEVISSCHQDRAYRFDSFVNGECYQDNCTTQIQLKDWTPMLASKGFHGMFEQWKQVVATGKMDTKLIERNLSSHRIAQKLLDFIT
ncbi:Gfo/Idh/MocA family protein [Vibrio variabilis]|uniref:Gfo/Idh/MocA family protein n=1 Tax=Vibrio variabilis TaxID=990271 RepID=UPI000DDAB79E|nr:Gfo/Idh/MocA family oxidoreductase [Vibrio variabilis]